MTSLQDGQTTAHGHGHLRFSGRNASAQGIEGRLTFAVEARLAGDGEIRQVGDSLVFTGGSEALILVDAATSFRRYNDVNGDPQGLVTARLDAAGALPFAELRRRHVADHSALFGRLSLQLGSSPATDLPTDRRIAANTMSPDNGLAALFVQYGRYLMLASSRPGTQPANLQGIWNDLLSPPWDSKYTANINLQMNYWLPDIANLGECMDPLLRLVEDLAETGRETARVHYGAPGWVLHHNTDLWRATGPIDGAKWGLWPTGGAWLCVQLWDHARFRSDDLAERLYPLMAGAAEFIAHVLVAVPGTDFLVTAPSLSPENVHPRGAALCYGPAMDRQIIRDLFDAVIEAGQKLQRDTGLLARLANCARGCRPIASGTPGSCRSGSWTGTWTSRRSITGTSRTFTPSIPSHKSAASSTP